MTVTRLSSREFNQDVGRAKKAAAEGPVVITDRGKPAHVLLTIGDYEKLTGGKRSLVKALTMPGLSGITFEPEPVRIESRPVDLS
ncbi:type II toxin-antitoxin system Phd/YefM family antitoxin [Roseibium litorale]|uniref:Antitoxin n=1 Tax=Roseibium litorale TaxID=2803841 RepID=A0ABR9CKB9_9HYPH|nr:type II toxin-antitoxin system Phd/YefM family antitoxin [Roseibium litorale]MBD8891271.1 type II toxin-antitoxin system Phd/YefM family antitoxin [Roseibium litorale]